MKLQVWVSADPSGGWPKYSLFTENGTPIENVDVLEVTEDLSTVGIEEGLVKVTCSMHWRDIQRFNWEPAEETITETSLTMLKVGGSRSSFHCPCGANVFRKLPPPPPPDTGLRKYRCQGCGTIFEGE